MQLGQLATDRRHADRVLEQPAGVDMVSFGCGRKRAHALPRLRVEHRADGGAQARMAQLRGEEVEEPVQLVRVAAHRRRERCGVGVRLFDRPHVELERVPESLDPAQDSYGVALGEPRVEELDVVPDPSLDPAGRVDELEREIVRARARPQPPLPRDRIDALHDAVFRELCNRRHRSILGPKAAGSVRLVARVRPFRAVRYDQAKAGPIEELVAPPYDVLAPEERARYLAENSHNVVHLTLPDDEERAAGLWRDWLAEGILVRDDEPALWWLEQDYVGPDGVARTRGGLVCALHVEPYSARVVLPHELTHAGPKEGRMRLLRALRAHVEPLFFLYEGWLQAP